MVLGGRLRRLREARGITRERAGDAIRASHSKISRLELGRVGFRERDVADLLTLYRVTDAEERESFLALARQANESGWWHRDADWLPRGFDTYLGLEQAASIIRVYEPNVVPELLQTPDYARAVLAITHRNETDDVLDRRVALRIRRQVILLSPDAPRFWVCVEEAALRRQIGGPEVWQAQLNYLAGVATAAHVTLQILPDTAAGPALVDGGFTVLRFAEPDLPDIVYLQHLTSSLYLDKRADLDAYLAVADRLSVAAAPPDKTPAILAAIRDHRTHHTGIGA